MSQKLETLNHLKNNQFSQVRVEVETEKCLLGL